MYNSIHLKSSAKDGRYNFVELIKFQTDAASVRDHDTYTQV